MFYQKNIFSFVLAAVFLVLAVKAPASLENFAQVPTFGSSSPGTAVDRRGPCIKQLISEPIYEPRLMPDEQLPIGDLTEFVRNDGLSSWFLYLGPAELANSSLSADRIYEEIKLSQKIENYSAQVDLFLDSPDVTVDRKLQVLLYNLAFVTQLVRNGSDEAADILRTKLAISDFMVRQLQWLQHPVFTDMILFAYSQFESIPRAGGAGPIAIPYVAHDSSPLNSLRTEENLNILPHFGQFELAKENSTSDQSFSGPVLKGDFVSLNALEILFENLLSPAQGVKVVAETALLIYRIYSRSQLFELNERLKMEYIFTSNKKGTQNRSPKGGSPFSLNRLMEYLLRPTLLDFQTHPLITLFFLQMDLRLFGIVRKEGRRFSISNPNILKMRTPVASLVIDFNHFADLLSSHDRSRAEDASTRILRHDRFLPQGEIDPQIALYMGDASGYTYDAMRERGFLDKYFARLNRIFDLRGFKSDAQGLNSFSGQSPDSYAAYVRPFADIYDTSPSIHNPLVYNLPSSVARTLVVSLVSSYLNSGSFSPVFIKEILNFRIGQPHSTDNQKNGPERSIASGTFGSQAQFLRTILGLPFPLPTSAILDSLSFIRSQVLEFESKAYQYRDGTDGGAGQDNDPIRYLYLLRQKVNPVVEGPSVTSEDVSTPPPIVGNGSKDQTIGLLDGALNSFYNWKLGLGNCLKKNDERRLPVEKNPVGKSSSLPLVHPTPYFSSPHRNRRPLEIDREGLDSKLRENILRFNSVSSGNDFDRSFGAKFSLALIIQDFIAEIKKIDAEVKEIHGWAMNKENGIIHWMNYLSRTWTQKVNGVDREDLRRVIERLSYDLELYSEIQVLLGKYSKAFDGIQPPQVQLNGSIERVREMRALLAAVFYRLVVGISDDPKDRNELHDIRMRMIKIGFDFPN
ncbi:MAG: hypothetical protein IPJ71_02900 [Bdellovibrionales bacterium]|nr:hypothetical protein [Bdellovibrionales bacterium]